MEYNQTSEDENRRPPSDHIDIENTRSHDRPSLNPYQQLSRFCRQKIVWTWPFDTFILLVITANCVFIAMEDPQREDSAPMSQLLDKSEQVFTVIFVVEMLVKWIALGWCGNKKVDYVTKRGEPEQTVLYCGYFFDGWNVLDFIIVLSSLSSILPIDSANTSSIRILRVLRPLRTIAKIKELRILVETILNSLRDLADVMLLLCFLFIIFAIVGVQLFSGAMRQRCYYDINPDYTGEHWEYNNDSYTPNKYYFKLLGSENPELSPSNCSFDDGVNLPFEPEQEDSTEDCFLTDLNHTLTYYADPDMMTNHGFYSSFLYYDADGEKQYCDAENKVSKYCTSLPAREHPTVIGINMTSSLCLRNDNNPDNGVTSFDNIFTALLMVFIVITLEGWVDIMYKVQVVSHPSSSLLFYLLCVVVAYFAMNLCIAVIEDVYSETVQNENDDGLSNKEREFINKHLPKKRKRMSGASQRYLEGVETALRPNEGARTTPMEDDRPVRMDELGSQSELFPPKYGSDAEGTTTRQRQRSSNTIHGMCFEGHKEDLKRMSSYALSLTKPKEALKVGQKSVGKLKSDPLEDAQTELIERQKIALRALAVVQAPPDEYYLRHKDNRFVMINRGLAQSRHFNEFVLFFIMLNTITLAIYWPGISGDIEDVLEILNYLFTLFFTIEMIIKLIGLGVKGYLSDSWNVFDGLIVIVSVVESLTSLASPSQEGGGAISALRAFRLLRVLRLLGQFESLRIILGTVITSLGDVSYLVIILLLFIFMFATLGISLFSTAFNSYAERNPEADFPLGRWRFDNIYWTMITIFQVITYDAWNQVMFDAKVATGNWLNILYFLAVEIFGGFIVLNLFVAILLSRMGSEGEDKWAIEASISLAHKLTRENSRKLTKDASGQPIETPASIAFKRKIIVESLERRYFNKELRRKQMRTKSNRDKHEMEGRSLMFLSTENPLRKLVHKLVINEAFEYFIDALIIANCVFLMLEDPKRIGDELFEVANNIFTYTFILELVLKVIALGLLPYPIFPIFGMRRWKPVARESSPQYSAYEYPILDALEKINNMDSQVVEPLNLHKRGIITRINLSSDGIAIVEWRTLKTLRLAFKGRQLLACYFLKEPGVEILSFCEPNRKVKSLENHSWHKWRMLTNVDPEIDKICRAYDMSNRCHNSYLSSKWNQLDAFVVLVSILGVLMPSNRMLRGVRGIRPLRIAVRIQAIKVILSALVRAVPAMVQVLVFCSSFWLVLAILGMNWFSGQFWSCWCDGEKKFAGDRYCDDDDCPLLFSKQNCADAPDEYECEWEDEVFNFNHVFESIHTLFVLATMSGWNDIMYRGVDVVGVDMMPSMNQNPHAAMYFVVIILVCAFFSLNLIISVVVDNFQRIKDEQDGSALMTSDQLKWVMTRRLVGRLGLKKSLIEPKQAWRKTIFIIVMHPFFDPMIMGCIVLNTLTMCLEYYGAHPDYNKVLDGLDTFYIVVFTVEALIKITGLGWFQYIRNSWNKFDFFIVIVGIVSLFELSGDASFNVLRLFRIGRVLRLINKAKTLRTHFLTLMYSIPSLWNIGLLILVIFFVYAVVGMHLFGTEDMEDGWEFGDSEANFQDFQKSMITLFRVSSGDGWSSVYERYLSDVSDETRPWVYVYFMSFFLVGALVMINLFIAVILDSFNEEQEAISREQELKTIKVWRAIWQEYDKDTTGTISAGEFIRILKCVPQPVGFMDEDAFKEQLRLRSQSISEGDTAGGITRFSVIECDPSDREILDLLVRLKLFVEKKQLAGNDYEEWCVDYQDALLRYATMLVGLDLDVEPPPEEEQQSMGAAEWYATENNCLDLANELHREYAREAKGREMARYMMDEYFETPLSSPSNRHGTPREREAGASTNHYPAIELQQKR